MTITQIKPKKATWERPRVSIRERIRTALKASLSANPYDSVDAVLESIPEGQEREYLRDAVSGLISTVASTMSRAALHGVIAGQETLVTTRHREIQLDPEGNEVAVIAVSPKRQLVRADWEAFLNSRLNVEVGTWVHWRDAMVPDLLTAADKRVARAESLNVEAEKYRAVAQVLERAGAKTVGELADGDLEEVRALAA